MGRAVREVRARQGVLVARELPEARAATERQAALVALEHPEAPVVRVLPAGQVVPELRAARAVKAARVERAATAPDRSVQLLLLVRPRPALEGPVGDLRRTTRARRAGRSSNARIKFSAKPSPSWERPTNCTTKATASPAASLLG